MQRIILLLLQLLFLIVTVTLNAQEQEIKLTGKQLFGSIEARHIGPALMSGRISDLELHPTNPRILYAGTAGGGVWKSTNGGTTFNPIFDDYVQSIGVVTVDPNQPDNVIWVGTGETWTRNSTSVGDGLFKSVDGGQNWDKIGFENSDRIAGIEINPKNSNEVYVGVLGALWGDSDERGVYKTTDGGKTWDAILKVDNKTGCSELIMDPNNPKILYAAFWEFRRTAWSFNSGGYQSALYKTTDAGKTWNKIHNGFPSGKLGRFAFAVAPSNSNRLYAVLETENKKDKGLWRSNDAGQSWEHLNNDFGLVVRPFYFSRIVVDPNNQDIVIKGGLNGSISRDGGKTFKSMGPMHSDIHDIAFAINNSDMIYAGTDGGVYRSVDGGGTMEIVENMPVSQFYHVSVDDAKPYNVYGGLQDNGSWYGPNSAPGGVKARHWNSVGYGDGFRVLKHFTKNIIYTEMQGAENVWRYDVEKKRIKTIQPLPEKGDPKLRFNWNAPMELSTHQPDRFYMGSQFLHKSENMGETWVKISPDLTTNDTTKQMQENSGGLSQDNSGAENHCTIFTIAESTLDENVIWVGTDDGQVQVTQNGGKKWKNVTKNIKGLPKNTWCYHIEASVFDKGIAYAVFDGHTTNDKNTYTYKTTDFGKTWKSIITDDIHGFARSFQEDLVNPDLLFLGTEFGLYITIDGGKHWNKFENNMPATAIHYMTMHKRTNDLVMGTHGRGVIIIDDVSPLREINQNVLHKKVHFFKTKPTVMKESDAFASFFGTETQFRGDNPSSAAKIVYYLKKRHTFGKMKLEVYDKQDKKVATLKAGKSKGINIVNWNYRTKQPKVAKGKTFSFGSFATPRAVAGSYKVVMTKGKETFEIPLELKYADNGITLSDRKEQERVTKVLYDMTEELAYMVYQIDADISAIDSQLKTATNASKLTKLKRKLIALKEKLVVTTGDNYVGQSEKQLREKLSDLYSKISGIYEKPTKAEMLNLQLLQDLYKDAEQNYQKLQSKRTVVKYKSFEDFIK
ncbi:MAG TPA: hypothetical protein EYG92_08400 [Lutibacter sp.]|nr:hypothetical protein [Lutibacter sp.]